MERMASDSRLTPISARLGSSCLLCQWCSRRAGDFLERGYRHILARNGKLYVRLARRPSVVDTLRLIGFGYRKSSVRQGRRQRGQSGDAAVWRQHCALRIHEHLQLLKKLVVHAEPALGLAGVSKRQFRFVHARRQRGEFRFAVPSLAANR